MSLLTQIGVVFILRQKSLIYQGVIQIIVWCCWSYCLPLNMRLIILFFFFQSFWLSDISFQSFWLYTIYKFKDAAFEWNRCHFLNIFSKKRRLVARLGGIQKALY